MNQKKAISEIITTILIILLVLAAIVIVWNVIKRVTTESAEEITTEQFSVRLSLSQIRDEGGNIKIPVMREPGAGELSAIKLILKNAGGETKEFEKSIANGDEMPDELETQVYTITTADLAGFAPVSVEAYPIIKTKAGKKIIGMTSGGGGITTGTVAPSQCTDVDNDGHNATSANCAGSDDCDDHNNLAWKNLQGYVDSDRDGWGAGNLINVCSGDSLPGGYSYNNTDCANDNNRSYPGATELCDGEDNNCDGDSSDSQCSGACDTDQDGHYSAWCVWLSPRDDCDDNDPSNYPGNQEICDGKDNNCDDVVDEGCSCIGNPLESCNLYDGLKSDGKDIACSSVGCDIYEMWCEGADFTGNGGIKDGTVDMQELVAYARVNGNTGCNYTAWAVGDGVGSDWCEGADFTGNGGIKDGTVDMQELIAYARVNGNTGCNLPENITIDCYSTAVCSGATKISCEAVPGCTFQLTTP